jgi:hypothetical protein
LSMFAQARAVVPGVLLASAACVVGLVLTRPLPLPALRLFVVAAVLVGVFLASWEICRRFLGCAAWPALAAPGLQMVQRFRAKLRRR